MIIVDIKIGIDGVPSEKNILFGNKYENNDTIINFELPSDFDNYNKYVIAVNGSESRIIPVLNNRMSVSSGMSSAAQMTISASSGTCRRRWLPWVSENAMMTLSLRDITRLVPYKVFYPRLSHGPSYLIDMLFYPAAASYRSNLLHYIADSQKKRLLNMRIKSF